MSSTYTDKNAPCFRWTNRQSHFGTFYPSNCLSHKRPANGCLGLECFSMIFGQLCRGRRIHISGRSDFGVLNNFGASSIFTWVHNPVVLQWHALPSLLSFETQTEPCSVNTAYEPESSFTMSPRSTTRPLHFWYFGSNSVFLRWEVSINVPKWTFFFSFCASRMTSFLLFTLLNCHAGNFLSFSHFFVHRSFRILNCHRLRHRNNLVHQIAVTDRIEPFSPRCDFSWSFGRVNSKRLLVDSCAFTIRTCFVFWMLLDSFVSL